MSNPRTCVTFAAPSFNRTEVKEYFINACCFGDDVAHWLVAELQGVGVDVTAEPGQEDFGWYVSFRYAGVKYDFVFGLREGEDGPGDWFGCIEGPRVGNLLTGRRNQVAPEVPQLLHGILSTSDRISNVRWHSEKDFQAGREEGAATPDAD